MSNDTNTPGTASQPAGAGGPSESSPAAATTAADAAAPASGAAPDPALATLKAEVGDLKDRILRAHAEMDNMRKRLEREKAEAHKYALTNFARDLLAVGDNLQRAIASVPAAAAEANGTLKGFLDGVTMTERELLAALERNGMKRLDPKGEPFNPHQHQAVMEAHNPEVPAGTVVQVFQCGYLIEDRVLRPAMVVVAKGGAKAGKAPEEGAAASTGGADAGGPGTSQG